MTTSTQQAPSQTAGGFALSQPSLAVVAVGALDQRPWISYGRISKRKKGDGAGAHLKIEKQHEDNARYLHGFAPGAEILLLQDNMSAWDPAVTRPDWERAMEMLRAGQVAGIVGWHADRLTRQVMQGELLLEACKLGNAQLHTVRGGQILSPLMFRIEGALAQNDSDLKSQKISSKHQLLARAGAYKGGPRPFGYEPGMTDTRESEARWVRWAAAGVLAGRSLHSLAAELNEKQVPTVKGAQWTGSNLGTYLRRPLLAGLRVHHGQVVGKAQWPAILDPATWEAVRTLLTNPARRTSQHTARRWLLSGIATCGVCGGPIRARNAGNNRIKTPAYVCQAGCVSRRTDLVESVVVAHVVARLSQVNARGLLTAPDNQDERVALEGQKQALLDNLDAMAEQAVLGTITQAMLLKATARVQTELASLDEQLAGMQVDAVKPAAVLEGLAGNSEAQAVWDDLDLDRRRAVISLLATVTLEKAARKGAPFDPALVRVEWKKR